jgi:hypothetical protein
MYRKSELSPVAIDRGWPHQVALPAPASRNGEYKTIYDFCKSLSLSPRGQSVFRDEWYIVYCFADREHAEKFMARFGGEPFNPGDRSKGA